MFEALRVSTKSVCRSRCLKLCSMASNRLAHEKSPYLLQHASNPVDWYPWGEDAFHRAKSENKLIFLSVGYSTCHWCHVMERESFENKEVARIMNDNFVNIKVDREERPDVDRLYMTFLQATTGSGGWPMSVWLTPELKPIFGGTYFPPEDRYYGHPGFKTVLKRISEQWRNEKEKFNASGHRMLETLIQSQKCVPTSEDAPSIDAVKTCYTQLSKRFEEEYGGFGGAPKFPQPSNFNFMFALISAKPKSQDAKDALTMCQHSLKMMAKGGIHDHIGQGFARYSTDKEWHVPHFEKMLYDQAQLLVSYVEMYVATQQEEFAQVARDIVQYVTRDLRHKLGGFYSAEDADSYPSDKDKEKKEGAFYVWTKDELETLLASEIKSNLTNADVFCYHYDVKEKGNVDPYKDPHDELKGKNVLIMRGSVEQTSSHLDVSQDIVEESLAASRSILFHERNKRPRPHLDDKMLTAWNGLMLSGLSVAGASLQDASIVSEAIRTATFIKEHLYNKEERVLLRSCYRDGDSIVHGSCPIHGFADDYAFTIKGLLDLYEACYDPQWIDWADELQERMNELFWDGQSGGYYMSPSGDESIVMRIKEDQDGAEPSANSVSVRNLLRIANYLDKKEYKERAGKILSTFKERLSKFPLALPEMVRGLMMYHHTADQIAIVGHRGKPDTEDLLNTVHSMLLPNKVLLFLDPHEDTMKESSLYKRLTFFRHLKMKNDVATAYVCHNYSCMLPVSSSDQLKQLLDNELR